MYTYMYVCIYESSWFRRFRLGSASPYPQPRSPKHSRTVMAPQERQEPFMAVLGTIQDLPGLSNW